MTGSDAAMASTTDMPNVSCKLSERDKDIGRSNANVFCSPVAELNYRVEEY